MRARFIAPSKDSAEKPVIYLCVNRVVDRRVAFVDEVFRACRDRFGERRKSGARPLRGNAAAAWLLWSAGDLRKRMGGGT